MRAVFDWSWQLLAEEEQRLLWQLSVFRGSFTRAAAETIAGASLPTLTRLAQKSLLNVRTAPGEGEQQPSERYELHELVRQFAETELMRHAAEAEAVRSAHSAYYLTFVRTCEEPLVRHEPKATLLALRLELNNIRQAWQWATTQAQWEWLQDSAYCLSEFFWTAGATAQAEHLYHMAAAQAALDVQRAETGSQAQRSRQRIYSRFLAMEALARHRQGKFSAVVPLAQEVIAVGQRGGELAGQMEACNALGLVLCHLGDCEAAGDAFAAILQLLALVGPLSAAEVMVQDMAWRVQLGFFVQSLFQGHSPQGHQYGVEGLRIAQELGALRGEMTMQANLAIGSFELEAYDQARRELEQGLTIMRRVGFRWAEGDALYTLGNTLRKQGDYGRALRALMASYNVGREIGNLEMQALNSAILGRLYTLMGHPRRAQFFIAQWAELLGDSESQPATFSGCITSVVYALNRGDGESALSHARQAHGVAVAMGHTLNQAIALGNLGHAHVALAQPSEGATRYQEAFDLGTKANHVGIRTETLAGLAHLALLQGS